MSKKSKLFSTLNTKSILVHLILNPPAKNKAVQHTKKDLLWFGCHGIYRKFANSF